MASAFVARTASIESPHMGCGYPDMAGRPPTQHLNGSYKGFVQTLERSPRPSRHLQSLTRTIYTHDFNPLMFSLPSWRNLPHHSHRFCHRNRVRRADGWPPSALAEARDERRGPTGCAYRPGRRQLRVEQNVVSGASSRRNFGPST
ncbi:hypothetical protein PAXINDRAFT_103104 [Paxillus involutus ATCC 200175]|uniref:Uncharacterized protein n=1 Tax=Paxillus involutus ATCC 200175 TaxID=664439 RepID=A0A0C9T795_PAXIN|nr:hypothetical protein PAXINDRAFT_103104 [Paxillus involutus ATCC 200175]